MHIEENVPLAPLTSFHIGGPARFFARVHALEELREALAYARERSFKTLVLGGGSNMLVDDAGFDGLVIKIELMGVEHDGDAYIAAAGENWDALVARAVADGLWGIENLSGIPGTVGAAPIQNIGAYGSEVKNTISWVEALDTQSGEVLRMQVSECAFAYRTSRFKQEPGRYVVLRVAFALAQSGTPNISYKDLAQAFAGKPGPGLGEVREAVLAIRSRKFPDLSKEGTAGSFFLNPVVSEEKAAELAARYPELPRYSAEGGIKLSLAWLLDNALQLKGISSGDARLFEKQPLVIAAKRGATANDVRSLAEKVKREIKKQFDIEIQEEVRILFS